MALSNAAAAAALDAVVDRVDAGAAAGKLQIYTASYGTLLAEFTLSDPAFGNATTASPSVATAAGLPLSTTAAATGTAAAFRVVDSDNNTQWEATGAAAVGTSGSGAMVIVTNTSIASGQTVNLTACTLSMPTALDGE
jgi:hypothetical protein